VSPLLFKIGTEYANASLRLKLLANPRSGVIENQLTYLARSDLTVGYNLVVDGKAGNLD
jgi:hypothetical protein